MFYFISSMKLKNKMVILIDIEKIFDKINCLFYD